MPFSTTWPEYSRSFRAGMRMSATSFTWMSAISFSGMEIFTARPSELMILMTGFRGVMFSPSVALTEVTVPLKGALSVFSSIMALARS